MFFWLVFVPEGIDAVGGAAELCRAALGLGTGWEKSISYGIESEVVVPPECGSGTGSA